MFLDKANKHLERYPHSRSAPKIMFWKAKTLEKQGHKSGALTLYKTLYETYPNQFYAFRAQQIVGNVGQPWKTDPHAIYPPNKFNNRDTTHLARYMKDPLLFPLTEELIAVEAWGDVSYLANIVHNGKPPPPLESWMLHQKGELALSIRIIRDYLDDSRGKGKPVKDPTLSKLLYPIVHTSEIKKHSQFNNLDPFLVQALTRQESYFNRLAVSSSRAMGLMQLLPSTAKDVAKWEKMSNFNTTSLFEPNTNVRLGTRYLRFLHEKFHGNSMLSVGAYNGGPGAMSRWVKTHSGILASDPDLFIENIPFGQSRDYIKKVYSHYWNYQRLYQDQPSVNNDTQSEV